MSASGNDYVHDGEQYRQDKGGKRKVEPEHASSPSISRQKWFILSPKFFLLLAFIIEVICQMRLDNFRHFSHAGNLLFLARR
jgi:hypothetical protein